MKIYISGPISGRDPETARREFDHVADIIRRHGHTAVNPMDIYDWGLPWGTCLQMEFDVIRSGEIDALYMLHGWRDSHGACLERYFAQLKGIPVRYQSTKDEITFNMPAARRRRGY